jgi:hypothetical protein
MLHCFSVSKEQMGAVRQVGAVPGHTPAPVPDEVCELREGGQPTARAARSVVSAMRIGAEPSMGVSWAPPKTESGGVSNPD